MAKKECYNTLIMGSQGNLTESIFCPHATFAEAQSLSKAFDTSSMYKCIGINSISRETTFIDGTFAFPAAVDMTNKRDAFYYVMLENAEQQSIGMGFEIPYDKSKSAAALETIRAGIVGKTLGKFGKIVYADIVKKTKTR